MSPFSEKFWWDKNMLISAGDSSEYNHEGHVQDQARRLYVDRLGGDSDQVYISDEELSEAEEDYCEEHELSVNEDDDSDRFKIAITHHWEANKYFDDMYLIDTAWGRNGDLRNVAAEKWGWVYINNHSIGVHTLTPQVLNEIADAVDAMLDLVGVYEGDEEYDEWLTCTLTITVASSGNTYSILSLDIIERNFEALQQDLIRHEAPLAQVRQMDVAAQPQCYGDNLGD